jgi:RNA polymerase sigma-70 factor (ECF subfamily)
VRGEKRRTQLEVYMQVTEGQVEIKELVQFANWLARRYGQIGMNDPEDIVQNSMLKLLKRTGNRPPTKGWLCKVVRSAAFDAGRAYSREMRNTVSIRDRWPAPAVCERADEDGYVRVRNTYVPQQEERDPYLLPQVLEALDQLTEPLRQVLILHAQGFSYQQIAELTNTNLGTVRSRLFYARRQAQLLLNDIA